MVVYRYSTRSVDNSSTDLGVATPGVWGGEAVGVTTFFSIAIATLNSA